MQGTAGRTARVMEQQVCTEMPVGALWVKAASTWVSVMIWASSPAATIMFLVLGGLAAEVKDGGDAGNSGADEGLCVSALYAGAVADAGRPTVPGENGAIEPASGRVGRAKLALGRDGGVLSRALSAVVTRPVTADWVERRSSLGRFPSELPYVSAPWTSLVPGSLMAASCKLYSAFMPRLPVC